MTVLSLPVYWFFSRRWQHDGLAMASSICVITYTFAIFFLLARRTKNAAAPGLIRFFAKIWCLRGLRFGVPASCAVA